MNFTTREIVYSQIDALKALLYVPEKPVAALVEVHGGAWIHGDLNSDAALNERLAAQGVLVMAIDFRTKAPYPAALADINLAIRWLKRETAAYGIAPERVGGLGSSSGGHLILLSAMRPDDARYTLRKDITEFDASLNFVVACWPVSDPAARYEYAKARNAQPFLTAHETWFPTRPDMDEANPLQALLRNESVRLPKLLIIQGGKDENFPPQMSRDLEAAYRSRGGDAELVWYADEPHGFIMRDADAENAKHAIARIVRFAQG